MCVSLWCCGQVLEAREYGEWVDQRREAEVALEQREEKLFACAKTIETQLELLGKEDNLLVHTYSSSHCHS